MRRALVVGCGQRVWRDVEKAQDLCEFDSYYVIKLAGVHWDGGYFTWITLHPEFMASYKEERAKKGLHSYYEVVAPLHDEVGRHGKHQCDRHITYRWPTMNASGSSGLFAVKIALDDGHDRVVLAGVPMHEGDGHFVRKQPWKARDSFMGPWTSHLHCFKEKTRSLSGGFTEQLLGKPTPEWLGVMPEN